MTLESLLLSQDVDLIRILRPTLEKLSIDVEVCPEAKQASEILISEKFDAVIVDCDDLQGGLAVLKGLRSTPSNKNSVTFAVLNGTKTTTQEVFGMGANFVMQKPISMLNAVRCFNAALSFMVRERRRYFRARVEIPVKAMFDGNEFQATGTNISSGGIALIAQQPIPKASKPRLLFTLPETTQLLDVESEVAWADVKGNAGLRFQNVPPDSLEQLEHWLNQRMEQEELSSCDNAPQLPS